MVVPPQTESENHPESEVHPLGAVIASVIEDGLHGQATLSHKGFEYVRRALDEYLDAGDALMDAVDTLLLAAHYIEVEHGGRSAAERLVALVDRPEVIAAMRQIAEAAEADQAQQVAQSAEKFSKFRGDGPVVQPPSTVRRARPQASAPNAPSKPKGAVRLGDLAFPKRL
ncbi:MAG: hypothetical protein AAF449_23945 [Myxococcota bacterium]